MHSPSPKSDHHVSNLENELERWRAKLDAYMAQAEATRAKATGDARVRLDVFKAKLVATRTKLDEARAEAGDRWESLKHGIETAIHELQDALRDLVP